MYRQIFNIDFNVMHFFFSFFTCHFRSVLCTCFLIVESYIVTTFNTTVPIPLYFILNVHMK